MRYLSCCLFYCSYGPQAMAVRIVNTMARQANALHFHIADEDKIVNTLDGVLRESIDYAKFNGLTEAKKAEFVDGIATHLLTETKLSPTHINYERVDNQDLRVHVERQEQTFGISYHYLLSRTIVTTPTPTYNPYSIAFPDVFQNAEALKNLVTPFVARHSEILPSADASSSSEFTKLLTT